MDKAIYYYFSLFTLTGLGLIAVLHLVQKGTDKKTDLTIFQDVIRQISIQK